MISPGRAPATPDPPGPSPAAERARPQGRRLAAAKRGRGISTWETFEAVGPWGRGGEVLIGMYQPWGVSSIYLDGIHGGSADGSEGVNH